MRHVLTHPATAAQRAKAEKLAKHEHGAARLDAPVGDPDEVADRHGDLPPDRRTWHLSSLMKFRHRLLRELDEPPQWQRFRTPAGRSAASRPVTAGPSTVITLRTACRTP
jgi:hypothetical protein